MNRIKRLCLFIFIFFSHLITAYFAWSFAPGNSPLQSAVLLRKVFWVAISFPLFWIVPDVGESYLCFIGLFLGNSLLWGIALVTLISKLNKKKE